MIVSIGQFQLKKRAFLTEFLNLSKEIYQQATKSIGNINCELDNEGIQFFYSFTHWESIEDMISFVHSNAHGEVLQETKKICKQVLLLHYETTDIIDLEDAKLELKNNPKTRKIIY